MVKYVGLASICLATGAIVLGCAAGKNLPAGQIRALPGKTGKVTFNKTEKAGSILQIEIENLPSGPNITAGLGGNFIEEGGKKEEKNFAIVAGGTCSIPGQELNIGESCTVSIEFKSGARPLSANYILEYGNRLAPTAAKAAFPIESE